MSFSCPPCGESFDFALQLREHASSLSHHIRARSEHSSFGICCRICKTTTNTIAEYSKHLDSEFHQMEYKRVRDRVGALEDSIDAGDSPPSPGDTRLPPPQSANRLLTRPTGLPPTLHSMKPRIPPRVSVPYNPIPQEKLPTFPKRTCEKRKKKVKPKIHEVVVKSNIGDKNKKWERVAAKGKKNFLQSQSQRLLKERMQKYRLMDSMTADEESIIEETRTETRTTTTISITPSITPPKAPPSSSQQPIVSNVSQDSVPPSSSLRHPSPVRSPRVDSSSSPFMQKIVKMEIKQEVLPCGSPPLDIALSSSVAPVPPHPSSCSPHLSPSPLLPPQFSYPQFSSPFPIPADSSSRTDAQLNAAVEVFDISRREMELKDVLRCLSAELSCTEAEFLRADADCSRAEAEVLRARAEKSRLHTKKSYEETLMMEVKNELGAIKKRRTELLLLRS